MTLDKEDLSDSPDCIEFVERTLYKAIHCSFAPHELCSLINKYASKLSPDFREYISFWAPNFQVSKGVRPSIDTSMLKDPAVILRMEFLNCRQKMNKIRPKIDLKMKKKRDTLSLIRQTLLYIQYELDAVLNGNDTMSFDLFLNVLEVLISKDTSLENQCAVRKHIFQHPVTLRWFLTLEEVVPDSPSIKATVDTCLARLTSFLFKELKATLEYQKELSETETPFLEKAIQFVLVTCDKKLISQELLNRAFFALEAVAHFLSVENVVLILNAMAAKSDLNRDGEELTPCVVMKKCVELLLAKYQELKTPEHCLELKTIRILFHDICSPPTIEEKDENNNSRELLFKFFETDRRNVFAISVDDGLTLLNTATTFSLKTAILFAETSPAHHYAFRQWAKNNCETLESLPRGLTARFIVVLLQQFSVNSSDEEDPLLQIVGQLFWQALSTMTDGSDIENEHLWTNIDVSGVLRLMTKHKIIGKSSIETILTEIRQSQLEIGVTSNQLNLLIQILTHFQTVGFKTKGILDPNAVLIQIIFNWLKRESQGEYDLQSVSGCVKQVENAFNGGNTESFLSAIETIVNLEKIITTIIDKAMNCDISDFISILTIFCKKIFDKINHGVVAKGKIRAFNILKCLFEHQNFNAVLLNKDNEFEGLKDKLLDLLTTLISVDGSYCQEVHIPFILASYQATLSSADRKILTLLMLYESYGVSLARFRPFYWGSSAVEHYKNVQHASKSRLKEPSLADVIDRMDEKRIINTIMHFPLKLSLKPNEITSANLDTEENEVIYDPRFFLPIFTHLMEPGAFIDCRKFIYSNCLGLVIASLTSQSVDVRSTGYTILSRLYQHLETSRIYEQELWMTFIERLIKSLDFKASPLPSIVAFFVVKCIGILSKPEDCLYNIASTYLLSFEVKCVPKFFQLFHSSNSNHSYYKSFILGVLRMGFRTNLDYHLCKKSFVFDAVLAYAASGASLTNEKLSSLDFLQHALKSFTVAYCLYKQNGFITWICAFKNKWINMEIYGHSLVSLIEVFWATSLRPTYTDWIDNNSTTNEITGDPETDVPVDDEMGNGVVPIKSANAGTTKDIRRKKHPISTAFPLEFLTMHITLLDSIKDVSSISTIEKYLKTLCDILQFLTEFEGKFSPALNASVVELLLFVATRMDNMIKESKSCFSLTVRPACRHLALRAMLYWTPAEELTAETAFLVHSVLRLVLKHEPTLTPNFARWFQHCTDLDSKQFLAGLLRNETDQMCSRLFLHQLACHTALKASHTDNATCNMPDIGKPDRLTKNCVMAIFNLGPMDKNVSERDFIKKKKRVRLLKENYKNDETDTGNLAYLLALAFDLWTKTEPSECLSRTIKVKKPSIST